MPLNSIVIIKVKSIVKLLRLERATVIHSIHGARFCGSFSKQIAHFLCFHSTVHAKRTRNLHFQRWKGQRGGGGVFGLPVVWFHSGCNSWTLWMVCASNRTVVPDYRTMMTHTMLMIATIPNRSDFDAARFARVSTSMKRKKNEKRKKKIEIEMKNQNDKNDIQLFCNGRFKLQSTKRCTNMDCVLANSLFPSFFTFRWCSGSVESAESDIECKLNCFYFEINTRTATICRFTLTYATLRANNNNNCCGHRKPEKTGN